MSNLEIAANLFNLASVVLAARNSIHVWWTGILGCLLFALLFFQVKLYADFTLQFFFIATSVYGWWNWLHGGQARKELPTTHVGLKKCSFYLVASLAVTVAYGLMLHQYTDASYPFIDSTVLCLSVTAQLLMMSRKVESWYFWIVVNTISVPLYFTKGLNLTAVIYALFWFNAFWGLRIWKREARV